MSVPYILYLAWYCLVDTEYVLEFIDNQGVVVVAPIHHEFLKQCAKGIDRAVYVHSQLPLGLLLKLLAKHLLIILGHI